MSNARKLFRLFKSLNEYVKAKDIAKQDLPQLDKFLALTTRLLFAFYWLFDNLVVLVKIKFINSIDLKTVSDKSFQFWFLALIFMIWHAIHNLFKISKDMASVRKHKETSVKEQNEAMKKLEAKRQTNIINLIKGCGDMCSASQGCGYPKRFLGFELNDTICGIGGFTSAYLTCWTMYPTK